MRMRGVNGYMRVMFWLWLCTVAASQYCPSATFSPSDVLESIFDNTVTDQLTQQISSLEESVPALFRAGQVDVYSVAVVYRNSTIYTAGMVDTPFRIGSITKVFTAMGALVLRQQGRLALDDPVKKLLPSFSVINPYGAQRDITLRELMGHLSGLPRELCAGTVYCGSDDEEEILRSVAKMQLARPPWSSLPTYSNLGFAILGHAWEKATSPPQPWGTFLRNAVLGPLEMHHTGLDFAHVKLAPGDLESFPSNASIGWLGPTGDMYSSALDLAKFLKFLLHPDPELLSMAAIREWIHPTTIFPDATSDPSSNFWSGYALPWELVPITTTDNRSTTLVTKGGKIGSYVSTIAFHPDSQLGVTVLTSMNATSNLTNINTITSELLQGLIPAVRSIHSNTISSLYSGVYICKRSREPFPSLNLPNVTFQVLEGSITVRVVASVLVADVNITFLQNGEEDRLVDSRLLVLRSGPDHWFWAYPGSACSQISGTLSFDPQIGKPNYPGSVYTNELRFVPGEKVVRAPSIGAECYRS